MRTSLRDSIDRGEYSVDPGVVADAILRRVRELTAVPLMPSQVLVPADLFQDPAPRSDQEKALAVDNGA
jgi:hypothetical protein